MAISIYIHDSRAVWSPIAGKCRVMKFLNHALLGGVCCFLGACANTETTGSLRSQDNRSVESIRQLAADIEQKGDDDTAIAVYLRAAQLSQNDPAILVRLGDIYMRQKKYAEAVAVYRSAVGKEPANADAMIGLGSAQIANGDVEQGLATMTRASSFAKTASAHNRMGVAQTQAGRFDDALASYARAIALSPSDIDIRTNMALASALAGRDEQAIGMMQQIVQSPTAGNRHRANLMLVLGIAGRDQEARAAAPAGMPKADVQSILKGSQSIRAAKDPATRGRALSIIVAS